MRDSNNTNPFLAYAQARLENYKMPVASLYQKSMEDMEKAEQKPKQKVFNSMTSLLKESFFVGSTKYGNNFIC